MKHTESEKKLIKALKEDPNKSFPLLFEQFQPPLYAHALRLLGRGEAAKDAVQDTFMTALTKIDQLRDKAAIQYWLHTILRNHCRMYLRRRKKEFHEGAGWGDLPDKPVPAAIVKQLHQRQSRESVLSGLSRLPEKLRLPLLLRYYSIFNSYQLIADILGIPAGTVRSRLSRAKKRLLKRFDRKEGLLQNTGKSPGSATLTEKYKDAVRAFYRGDKTRFLECFAEDLQLRFTSGKEATGRRRWALEWEEDLESGVRFQPNQILSSGGLTIMEGAFRNPPHDPHHCPPVGAFVLFHRDEIVYKVHVHYGEQLK